ncbi:MAG: MotA/TolQ/ExbB proton channel family protein [Planctomycetaceae bacterium]|nr:MAG: MotA/TolQ/ExbB proton channel family protein [Planctomycetaceae bacterium]
MIEYFFKGGPVMYPLLLCSVISLTVIIERVIFWIREEKNRDRTLLNELMSLVEKEQFEEAKKRTLKARDYVIRTMVCGVVHRNFSLRDALQMSADEEIARMRRHLPILDTMITLSPLLGILGTVTGIIYSFNMLGTVGAEHPQLITVGIAQALITTAFGLTIAILSLIPYNYFLSKIEKAALEMEKYGTNLEIIFERKRNSG